MISEDDAKTLIDQHLVSLSWDIADFNTVRKNWSISRLFPGVSTLADEGRKRPDYTLLLDGQPVALIEAKRPGKDLQGALQEAKIKANIIKKYVKVDIPLIFSSDGRSWIKQNLYVFSSTYNHFILPPSQPSKIRLKPKNFYTMSAIVCQEEDGQRRDHRATSR